MVRMGMFRWINWLLPLEFLVTLCCLRDEMSVFEEFVWLSVNSFFSSRVLEYAVEAESG